MAYIPPETVEAERRANLEVRYRALAAFHRVCGEVGPKLAWRKASRTCLSPRPPVPRISSSRAEASPALPTGLGWSGTSPRPPGCRC
jgi:hypothetical protein